MVRAISIDEGTLPQVRPFSYEDRETLDGYNEAVGFCCLDHTDDGQGTFTVTFPTLESIHAFYRFLLQRNRQPRKVTLRGLT